MEGIFLLGFYSFKLKTKGGPDGSSPLVDEVSLVLPAQPHAAWLGQVWNGTAVPPQRNPTKPAEICMSLFNFEINRLNSFPQAVAAGFGGRGDGF